MGIMMPETCWVNLLWMNIYTYVICWFFLLLHGVSSQKTGIYVRDVVKLVRLLLCVSVDAEVNEPLFELQTVEHLSSSGCEVTDVDCVWNVMAHAQKPDFVFRRNGRVHLNRRGRQFSRLLTAEVCASAVVMLDTPCSEVVWRVLATHFIRHFPLYFPPMRHRVPSHFNWTLLKPPPPLSSGYRGSFPEKKQPQDDVDDTSPAISEVENEWRYASSPALGLHLMWGINLHFLLLWLQKREVQRNCNMRNELSGGKSKANSGTRNSVKVNYRHLLS